MFVYLLWLNLMSEMRCRLASLLCPRLIAVMMGKLVVSVLLNRLSILSHNLMLVFLCSFSILCFNLVSVLLSRLFVYVLCHSLLSVLFCSFSILCLNLISVLLCSFTILCHSLMPVLFCSF